MNKLALSLILVAACSVSVGAADFDNIVNRLTAKSYSVNITAAQGQAEYLQALTENNLSDTEVELSHEWGSNADAGNKLIFNVSQGFDWPGLYRARSHANQALRERTRADAFAAQSESRLQIEQLLVDIIYQRMTNELLGKVAEGYNTVLQAARQKYDNNNITILDLNKIIIEAADADIAFAQGIDAVNELLAELNQLSPDAEIALDDIPRELPLIEFQDEDFYLSHVNEASPEVAQAIAQSRYSDAMLSVARQERAPGFSLGYVMEKEIDATFHGFTIGLNLPIFSSRGKVAAAQAQLAASSAVADQARLNLERKVKADYKKALSLKKQIAAYGPAIALTDNLALIRKAYEMGQCDIDHFFIDMNFFLQAQQNYFDIERQYTSTLLSLRNLTR